MNPSKQIAEVIISKWTGKCRERNSQTIYDTYSYEMLKSCLIEQLDQIIAQAASETASTLPTQQQYDAIQIQNTALVGFIRPIAAVPVTGVAAKNLLLSLGISLV